MDQSIGKKLKHSVSGKTGTSTGSHGGNISSLEGGMTRTGLNNLNTLDSLPIAL